MHACLTDTYKHITIRLQCINSLVIAIDYKVGVFMLVHSWLTFVCVYTIVQ